MTEFLLFTLYAPLSSWGEIAVGESRGSWDRPSRSAILGFVAASLGLVREDQAAHDTLETGYGVAVRLDAAGVVLGDYHTAQTVSASAVRKRRPRTRAELLAIGDPETILSRRTYRQDALATAGLWCRAGAPWPLRDLVDALRRPKFVLYAGRKANALGLPVDPEVVVAESLADAFRQRTHERPRHAGLPLGRLQLAITAEVSHDQCDGFPSGLHTLRREVRRDTPSHRRRWQFSDRVVEVGVLGPALADEASVRQAGAP